MIGGDAMLLLESSAELAEPPTTDLIVYERWYSKLYSAADISQS